MNTAMQNKLRFLASVKRSNPRLYRAAVSKAQISSGLSGLGITVDEMLAEQNAFAEPVSTATNSTSFAQTATNSVLDIIKQLAPVYVGTQQAKTCIQVNAERAKNGLSPIDCAAGGLAPQVGIGVSSDVKMIMYVALGIGAVFVLSGVLHKHRKK
jgi:hypothetical protein